MTLEIIFASFGAGVFASMIGGVPVFIMTGFIVVAGLSGGMLAGADGWSITDQIGFGIFLGPHITFGSAAAAAAYAKKKGFMITGDTSVPLIKFNNAGILFVGGFFGILAYVLNYIFLDVINLPTDTVALTVTSLGIISRLLYSDKGLMPNKKNHNYLPTGENLKVTALLSASIGMVSSYYAVHTGDTVLAWSLSAISLIFVQMGCGGFAFHHIGIVSATAGVATGNVYVGMLFGLIAGLLGYIFEKMFNENGETHLDPPAITIALLTTVIILFLWWVIMKNVLNIFLLPTNSHNKNKPTILVKISTVDDIIKSNRFYVFFYKYIQVKELELLQ